MEDLCFDQEVLREFTFLTSNGFVAVEVNPTRVVFRSDLYEIVVFHGHRAHEIDLEFAALMPSDKTWGCYSFEFLVAAFDPDRADRLPMPYPIDTREGVAARVHQLAQDFSRSVDMEWLKSRALLDRVDAAAKAKHAQRYPQISLEELRARFASMWEGRRYSELVNLFDPLASYLTPEEVEKLNAAKTALRLAN
jgi:hypothetical protein